MRFSAVLARRVWKR